MSGSENAVFVVAARWLTPLGALFAFTLLANWPPGSGVGFVAGLAFALPIAMNALIFGVRSILATAPPFTPRAVLALGVVLALAGAGIPNFSWSVQLVELGAFMATASSVSLVSLAIMGRAGALRDATW
jgi:multisubunit Na+/H+ antiporter MnhB subunit